MQQQYQNKPQPNPPQNNQPLVEESHRYEDRTYLSWEAPGRPFKERSREFFVNGLLIMLFLEIILFLFSQYLLMAVVFALVFLSFALSSVPPRHFTYKITSQGVLIDKSFCMFFYCLFNQSI